jgi:hypothetical protein
MKVIVPSAQLVSIALEVRTLPQAIAKQGTSVHLDLLSPPLLV